MSEKKMYLVTETWVADGYSSPGTPIVRLGETREELPPNARVLTREQVEELVFGAFLDAESLKQCREEIDELFGPEETK